jgi:lysophospholipase L1-like esterase
MNLNIFMKRAFMKKIVTFLTVLMISMTLLGCGSTSASKSQVNNTNVDKQQQNDNSSDNSTSALIWSNDNTIDNNNTTTPKKTKVACVGDSITEGYGLTNKAKESYPTQLQHLLGDNYIVKNFGKSNKTLMRDGNDPYVNISEYNESKAFNPDIVIIMLGTNDAKPYNFEKIGAFKGDYEKLIESYKSLDSNPTIYIATPPPSFKPLAGITDNNVKHIANIVRKIADEKSLELIDVYDKMKTKSSLFPDGIHPNAKGAKELADVINSAL